MEVQSGPVIVNSVQSQTLQRDYACAGCWGHLNSYITPDGGFKVVCDRCGDGRGFVRKAWTERRRQENMVEAGDVRRMLRQIHVISQQPMTENQILHDLGF